MSWGRKEERKTIADRKKEKRKTPLPFLTLERDELVDLGRGRHLGAIRAPPFGSEGANCGEGFVGEKREEKG